ncbi:MAG TPA: hypothetical protein VKR56_15215 [Candidatus Cybelea sp.]|nr:hypothetical protein [Candidatus Cybelea sp.]
MTDFLYQSNPWILPAVMLVVLGLAIEVPYRLRAVVSLKNPNFDPVNALQAGLLTLAAFVLGLSFSQASARFDARRAVVIAEANAIGTAWLRADQLEPADSRRFRQILTDATAAGLVAYQSADNPKLTQQTAARTARDENQLWGIASSAMHARGTIGLSLLMQSVNNLIDVLAQQRQALASHVPTAIVVLTLCLVTLGALSFGVRFALDGARPLGLSIIYVLAYVIVIEMMVDYDRPKTGFVSVNLTPMTEQLRQMQGGR